MTATTISHMGKVRRHFRTIHFPDHYSLGPVFVRDHTTITDADLAHLSALRSLSELDLVAPHVTDDGLSAMRHMPTLRSLHLCCLGIRGGALAHLVGLKHLKELSLHLGEPLSDDAVPHLRKLRSLRSLRANAATLSPTGEQTLRDALPRCLFHLGYRPAADEDRYQGRRRPYATPGIPMTRRRGTYGEGGTL